MKSKVTHRRIVAVKGSLLINNLEIGFVNVYGPHSQSDRYDFFDQLNYVISSLNCPIVVGGDFNMESRFTWFRGGPVTTASILDRILISPEIACLFPGLVQFTLPRSVSDHNLVFLKAKNHRKFIRPFKWFNHWSEDSILVGRIKDVWELNRGKNIMQSLLLTKVVTKDRARSVRDSNPVNVEIFGKQVEELESKCISNPFSNSVQSDLVALKARLWAILRKEEREWLQKSRLRWFKEGDRNTKFFHLTASSRAKRNQINKLKVHNSVLKRQDRIQQAFVSYFRGSYNDVKTIPVKIWDI
ncbi:uncharacterized protein LOC120200427 [Hibiscus syriacus]|uniref:uncharacterized protein LOC120200427 n=1 Tax=Hibiscus syriacus TaxID=106335 RepID=UPI001920A7B2|nr:uncharacterized protein LOC120200427 [Hibiscus syriacus]